MLISSYFQKPVSFNLKRIMRSRIITALWLFLFSVTAFAQSDPVKNDGITSDLHRANIGKITFMEYRKYINHFKIQRKNA